MYILFQFKRVLLNSFLGIWVWCSGLGYNPEKASLSRLTQEIMSAETRWHK